MSTILQVVVFVLSFKYVVNGYSDLIPEAITVYRNPQFFKNLNYGTKTLYNEKPAQTSKEHKKYRYPSEVHKPNPPPASPGFEVNYDNSPEFQHEPRDIFINTARKPNRKKGPYSPVHDNGSRQELRQLNATKPVLERTSEEKEKEESGEKVEKESVEDPQDSTSVFNENLDEEFKAYHEPILFSRPNFDPAQRSGVGRSSYSQPYPYNRTAPVLYDDWKFYTYPKIHANEHLKLESRIYSAEPPSNSFEDDSSSYYGYEDKIEDPPGLFEENNFKNLGADTKHIYKKLLKPKKSFLLKINSKPKFKKIKFHLKKKHPLKTDWFDEYPFNF